MIGRLPTCMKALTEFSYEDDWYTGSLRTKRGVRSQNGYTPRLNTQPRPYDEMAGLRFWRLDPLMSNWDADRRVKDGATCSDDDERYTQQEPSRCWKAVDCIPNNV